MPKGVYPRKGMIERFLENISYGNSCWEWRGRRDWRGYGEFNIKSKKHKAHRVSYVLFKGPIPSGMLVMHSCDNYWCVCPRHLSLGTYQKNTRDSVYKGRWSLSKLKPSEVLEIREFYPQLNKKDLASKYNVSLDCIKDVLDRKTWKQLEEHNALEKETCEEIR